MAIHMYVRHLCRTGILVAGCGAVLALSCAGPGLVSERYPDSFYKIPVLMPADSLGHNPTFLVYGDTQGSWLVNEKFVKKRNWATWKMALVPFYQLYLLTNGFVGGIDYLRHNPDYGERQRAMVRDAVYREARDGTVDFLLHLGDMAANDGRIPEHWADFLEENKERHPLLREVPLLPTLGNHDRANDPGYGYPNYRAIFGYPRFYTMAFPDAMLFVVDSNFILDQYGYIPDAEQDSLFRQWFVSGDPDAPAWLERKLLGCDKPFKLVSFHHPPFPFGGHYDDWSNPAYGPDLKGKRARLLHLLERTGVQVVFSGHEHFYQHSVWRYDGEDPGKKMHFIVSSGGGALLRDGPDEKHREEHERKLAAAGFDVELVDQAEEYHFTRVTITSTRMRISTIAVAEDPAVNGTIIEEIVIDRP